VGIPVLLSILDAASVEQTPWRRFRPAAPAKNGLILQEPLEGKHNQQFGISLKYAGQHTNVGRGMDHRFRKNKRPAAILPLPAPPIETTTSSPSGAGGIDIHDREYRASCSRTWRTPSSMFAASAHLPTALFLQYPADAMANYRVISEMAPRNARMCSRNGGKGLSEVIVNKDFRVCWVLQQLFTIKTPLGPRASKGLK
jgi:hypothetical protein